MCGRFVNINKLQNLLRFFSIKDSKNFRYYNSYNIAPFHQVNIITNTSSYFLESAKWGFSFYDKKENINKYIINSRLESIRNKLIFKDSFEKRKCIIPTNGFYEWKTVNKQKIPYFIHLPNLECFFFAGIWKFVQVGENKIKSFSIITKNSNNILKQVHNRMPVLLSYDESKNYLDNDKHSFLDISFNSYLEDSLLYYEVSKFVNNIKNNSKECTIPVN